MRTWPASREGDNNNDTQHRAIDNTHVLFHDFLSHTVTNKVPLEGIQEKLENLVLAP